MIVMALDLEMNKKEVINLQTGKTETTCKIIEVGVTVGETTTGEVLETLSVIVNPHEELAPFIIELTSIQQEDVDNGVSLLEAYEQVKALHKKYNCFCNPVVWGQGDPELLKTQLGSVVPGWIFGRRHIDTKTLYVSYRIANGSPIQGGLAKAMTKFGLAFKGKKHRAVDDSLNTFVFYCHLIKLLKIN